MPCATLNMHVQLQLIQRSETEPAGVIRVSTYVFVYLYIILEFPLPNTQEFVKKLKCLHGALILLLLPSNISLPPLLGGAAPGS